MSYLSEDAFNVAQKILRKYGSDLSGHLNTSVVKGNYYELVSITGPLSRDELGLSRHLPTLRLGAGGFIVNMWGGDFTTGALDVVLARANLLRCVLEELRAEGVPVATAQ